MGGWGSGCQGGASAKRQADGSFRLSAPPAWMVAEGRGVYVWSKVHFSVRCEIGAGGADALLSYATFAGPRRQSVGLVSSPSNLRGRRFWWLCPDCSRRCLKLYLPPRANLFGCRLCHDLSYESAQSSRQRYYELFKSDVRQYNSGLRGPQGAYLRSIGIRPLTATHLREKVRERIGGFTVAPYAGTPQRWPSDSN